MKEYLFKKETKRKLFSVVLALAMVVALMPNIPVKAAEKSTCPNGHEIDISYGARDSSEEGCYVYCVDSSCAGFRNRFQLKHTQGKECPYCGYGVPEAKPVSEFQAGDIIKTGDIIGYGSPSGYWSYIFLVYCDSKANAEQESYIDYAQYALDKSMLYRYQYITVEEYAGINEWKVGCEDTGSLFLYPIIHEEHNFKTTVEGNHGNIACDKTGCVLTNLEIDLSLELNVEDVHYDYEIGASVKFDEEWYEYLGIEVSDIQYYQGETQLESEPTEIGSYTVKVTVAGETISKDFEIKEHLWEDGKCTKCEAVCEHKDMTTSDKACAICAKENPDYTVMLTEGELSWTQKTDEALSFRSSADISKLVRVEVDDKEVAAENYDVTEGSTIVTLKASYLETLAVGKHTISIVSSISNGEAKVSADFEVKAVEVKEVSPKTGDATPIALYVLMMGLAGAGIVATKKRRAVR